MTLVMFWLAFAMRTPVLMWCLAMVCDAAMVITYLLTRAA